MLVESRVRREVQARFGGEFLETYRRNTARHRVLKCRNIVRRNYDRRILCDITTLFLLAAFNQEGSESAQENVFLADLGGTHLFHKPSTTAKTVAASTPVSRAICFTISCFVIDA